MKYIVLAVLAVVQADPIRHLGWSTTTTAPPGWSSTTTAPTPGWSSTTTAPTPGWSSTTTPGWSQPPTSGWSSPNIAVNVDATLNAAGSGSAAESHAESVNVVGGWGVPAEISIIAGGESAIEQQGQLIQSTSIDGHNVNTANLLSVSQAAEAQETLNLAAQGLEVNVEQSGDANSSGEATLDSNAATAILVNGAHV